MLPICRSSILLAFSKNLWNDTVLPQYLVFPASLFMLHILQKHQAPSTCRASCRPHFSASHLWLLGTLHTSKCIERHVLFDLLRATSALRSCESCGQVKNNLSSCGPSASCSLFLRCLVLTRFSTLPQMPVSNCCYFSRTIKGSLAGGTRLAHLGLCQAFGGPFVWRDDFKWKM